MIPYSYLFLAISKTLADLKDADDQPLLAFVDQDLGQLEYSSGDGRVPVAFPCALIDIAGVALEPSASGDQNGAIQINVRLGFPPYSSALAGAPTSSVNDALQYYNIETIVYNALHRFHPKECITGTNEDNEPILTQFPDTFGQLLMSKAFSEDRGDFIRVRVLSFTTTVYVPHSYGQLTIITPVTPHITTTLTT